MASANKRYRNFATIVYPDSAPDGWVDLLIDAKIPAFISPLHDRDINPGGEPKKPHYHVVLMYEGVKTTDQVREVFDMIGGVGLEVVNSIRGQARYLCHLDNPEKYQYQTDDVKSLCGADYIGIIGLPIDKYKSIGEMIDFCEEYSIYSYAQLLKYSRENRSDWFRVLCDSATLVLKEYLKSKSWTDRELNRLDEVTSPKEN